MDELIQKGWGLGSGISLFIVAGVTQEIAWKTLSPLPAGDGLSIGVFFALAQTLAEGRAFDALFRTGGLPDLFAFFATGIIFVIIVYLEGFRIEIPVAHAKYRGFRGKYPVKLFYVSVVPVILASALFADVFFAATLVWNRSPDSFLSDFLGRFDGEGNPLSGMAYYFTAPRSLGAVVADPIRSTIYVFAFVGLTTVFAWTWVSIAGLGPRTVAKQLIDSGMQVPGFRRSERSVEDLLQRYIPVVTILGGALVGLIAAVADFTNAFGSGTGILLMTSILWQYYQLLAKERIEEMYPGIGKLLGRT